MYAPILVAAPSETPISLTEAKAWLRQTGSGDDALIGSLIGAATGWLDGYSGILGRCLVTQTWRQDFDCWAKCLRLPMPAATIASVKYRASAGTLSTVAAEDYSLKADELGSYVRFDDDFSFPGDLAETQAILVEFTAGYGAATAVPEPIKLAIRLKLGHAYALAKADPFLVRDTVEGVGTRAWGDADKAGSLIDNAVDGWLAPFRRVGI